MGVAEQIWIGAAGSLVASFVIWLIGRVAGTKASQQSQAAIGHNSGFHGTNHGTVSFDQRSTTIDNRSTVTIKGTAPTSSSDDVALWLIGAAVASVVVGTTVSWAWRFVTLVTIPMLVTAVALSICLLAVGPPRLRGAHLVTLLASACTVVVPFLALRRLPVMNDVSAAVAHAGSLGDATSVVMHLSPDKATQLTAAVLTIVGLVMALFLVVARCTAAVIAAAQLRNGGFSGGRWGAIASGYRRSTGAVLAFVIALGLAGTGLWLVDSGVVLNS